METRFNTVLKAVQGAGGGTWSERITRDTIKALTVRYVDDNAQFWDLENEDETSVAIIRKILENAVYRVDTYHLSDKHEDDCNCVTMKALIMGWQPPMEEKETSNE
jgi:hypothetical protein